MPFRKTPVSDYVRGHYYRYKGSDFKVFCKYDAENDAMCQAMTKFGQTPARRATTIIAAKKQALADARQLIKERSK